jgi:hypothetical protein
MPSLTKPFTLPGLRLADLRGIQEAEHAASRRKVHLYVPPPLVPEESNARDGRSKDQNSYLLEANGTNNLAQPCTDADVYPSPSLSRVSRPSVPRTLAQKKECTDIRLTPESLPTPAYRSPSPPTPDHPTPSEDTDIHIHIDPQDVRRKHPATKALFEKVFR